MTIKSWSWLFIVVGRVNTIFSDFVSRFLVAFALVTWTKKFYLQVNFLGPAYLHNNCTFKGGFLT
jgi:hypothetical protein